MKDFLSRLACKIGWHDWRYWHMAPTFIAAFPFLVNVERTCRRCDRIETADEDNDGKHTGTWTLRL